MRILHVPLSSIVRGGHADHQELVDTLRQCHPHRKPAPNMHDHINILQFKWLRELNTDELLLVPRLCAHTYSWGHMAPEPTKAAPTKAAQRTGHSLLQLLGD